MKSGRQHCELYEKCHICKLFKTAQVVCMCTEICQVYCSLQNKHIRTFVKYSWIFVICLQIFWRSTVHHASFTPLVVFVDGTLGHETLMYLQSLADRLSSGWDKCYGHVLIWIRVHLAFAIIRATNLCFCGSYMHWWSGTSSYWSWSWLP